MMVAVALITISIFNLGASCATYDKLIYSVSSDGKVTKKVSFFLFFFGKGAFSSFFLPFNPFSVDVVLEYNLCGERVNGILALFSVSSGFAKEAVGNHRGHSLIVKVYFYIRLGA